MQTKLKNISFWWYLILVIMFVGFTSIISVLFGNQYSLGYLEGQMDPIPAGILFILGSMFPFTLLYFLINLSERQDEIEAVIEAENNVSIINFLEESLTENPEQTRSELRQSDDLVQSFHINQALTNVFKKFLNEKNFENAKTLMDYHDVDAHQLLRVTKALDKFEKDNTLDLRPTAFKLTLEKGETAYEKLPCNWQKIHTYLAPLEDEIEQADILDSGNIYITDQRVFFVGKKGSETVRLSDIAYMDHKEDALQFFRDEGLSEIFAFPTPHHATYAKLVIEELMG